MLIEINTRFGVKASGINPYDPKNEGDNYLGDQKIDNYRIAEEDGKADDEEDDDPHGF